ncbi:MAG: 50S ribosome-binding GTPase [Actinomycetota bacterium]|nr:50S ribosome-binding GTPase [Actinomycetota bacterium]
MEVKGGAPRVAALGALRDALAALSTDQSGERAQDLRARLLAEIDGHLILRATHPNSPVVVGLAGPTGAGKSTLVNGLARSVVSPAGALRPTTRTPVLVHRPEDTRWFPGERRRVTAWDAVHPVASHHLPEGVALLDTPDVDSARHGRHGYTGQLLATADVWLFVTTATRYADAVPWETLRSAVGRRADLAVVLDRVQAEAVETVEGELRRLLDANGLATAVLLVIPETSLTNGRLPDSTVAPVRNWLEGFATGRHTRQETLQRTLGGAAAALAEPLAVLEALVGGDRRLREAIATALGGPR